MKRVVFGIAVVALVAVPIACSNPFAPDTDQSVILGVTKLDAPAAIAVGSSLTVILTVTTGGCVTFDHIEVERSEAYASLAVWGRDAAKGNKNIACTADIRNEPHSYQLDPPFQNPFRVQVPRGRLSPLIATVQVQ